MATRAVRYDPAVQEYSYRDGTGDHVLSPGGGGPHAPSHEDQGSDVVAHDDLSGSGTLTHAQLDSHAGSTANPHSVTAGQAGADAAGTAAAAVSGHAALATGVHGAGVSTLATTANITTHAGATSSVHGFDSSGNAPPQSHAGTHNAGGGDALAIDAAAGTGSLRTLGTGATAACGGADARLSDARTPTSHDGTKHSETLAQVAGQLGGTSASPDVRGIRTTTGPTLLTLGAIADGEYLKRSGNTVIGGAPGGGSSPAWHGVIHSNQNGCDPLEMLREWTMTAVAGPTPTAITASIARCCLFRCPAAITVARVRLFGVGAVTNLYKFAIYPKAVGSARTWESGTVTSAANTWLNISAGLPISLSSGAEYWFCVTVVSTGTTAGFRSLPAPLGTTFWGASAAPIGNRGLALGEFAQFAVSSGVFPATLPTIAAAAYANGATGSVPFALLDSVA